MPSSCVASDYDYLRGFKNGKAVKQYLRLFDFSAKVEYRTEVLSGLTVAIALVPEAVAFAMIAGLSPLIGLYAAFVMGLVTSVFGGRPGMISGATGAVAVVIVALAKSHGTEYIFAAVVLAGLIQMAAGLLRLGKLMRLRIMASVNPHTNRPSFSSRILVRPVRSDKRFKTSTSPKLRWSVWVISSRETIRFPETFCSIVSARSAGILERLRMVR